MSERDDGGTPKGEDVVLLHSPTETGDGIRVLRKRDESLEIGELRPMREGQPIHGEVVRLSQREESSLLFDCEVLVPGADKKPKPQEKEPERLPAAPKKLDHKGPARVTTDAYRGGWDVIFGAKPPGTGGPLN
ncbi:MAG: hypothetical protein R3B70_03040 [Polyangiaceae bacterium]